MKILVVGGGGREHALAWKFAQSTAVERVLVAPGNAGTAFEPGVDNVDVAGEDVDALLRLARDAAIDLTVVGPEAPLVAGIVDEFQAAGLTIVGPTRRAAQLEGSKAFAKAFMARHGIPTAGFGQFTDIDAARAFLTTRALPVVVKADGLAAGKGVVIAPTRDAALAALQDMLVEGRFGAAGRTVVIEDYLTGEEASFICLADGEDVVPFAGSQDHKARDDGDRGPNTGGMGAYSPAPVLDAAATERVMSQVIRPTLAGMVADGMPYRGFLYAGLMIDAGGDPHVLEFNCRFGDPEAQPVLMRLESDLADVCLRAATGRLAGVSLSWDARVALAIVMAAGGYPGDYARGAVISGLQPAATGDTRVFHAGTRQAGGQVLTNGGRVLSVCGLGDSVQAAASAAYDRVRGIRWDNAYYRTDIGHRAIARGR